jgi:hypothetical protein
MLTAISTSFKYLKIVVKAIAVDIAKVYIPIPLGDVPRWSPAAWGLKGFRLLPEVAGGAAGSNLGTKSLKVAGQLRRLQT